MLSAFGIAACGDNDSQIVGPEIPGSIDLTIVTSGFLKDDSYELIVNGEPMGTIAASVQMTLSELEPATYEFELGDVAENCTTEATSVVVASNETAAVTIAVACLPSAPSAMVVRASRDRPDLDTGDVIVCTFGICPSDDAWDFFVQFDSQSDPQAIVRQNTTIGVEIAHVAGVTLADLTDADYEGATFMTELVDDAFDAQSVVLIRTDAGRVYALGNPVEQTLTLQLTCDVVLIDAP